MDKYTKGILTVIAICLVSITFQLTKTDVIENANAQGNHHHNEYASSKSSGRYVY